MAVMAFNNTAEDPSPLSYDEYWDGHYSRTWNLSRSRVLQRSGATRKAILELLHELHDSMTFLKKAFVDRQDDLPTMEASLKSMVASISQEYGPFQLKVELLNKLVPTESTPADESNVSNSARGEKRTRGNEDQVTSPEKRQKPVPSGHSKQVAANVADRACGQWHTRTPHDATRQSPIYIMPDITPKISRAEVEAQHWVFRYPAHGKGYYIIRCPLGSCTKSKAFTRHPFDSGQAMQHFNDPRSHHGKGRFSEAEIMRAFALEVQDARDDWVISSNITLSQPSPSATSQATLSKKPKTKALAGRSATKAVARKPSTRIANAEPCIFPDLVDTNYSNTMPQHGLPIDLELGNPSDQPQPEETLLPEIMVQTGNVI